MSNTTQKGRSALLDKASGTPDDTTQTACSEGQAGQNYGILPEVVTDTPDGGKAFLTGKETEHYLHVVSLQIVFNDATAANLETGLAPVTSETGYNPYTWAGLYLSNELRRLAAKMQGAL